MQQEHRSYTPPTYLPVRKADKKPDDHDIINPALRDWLKRKAVA